jgi:TolB-like protein
MRRISIILIISFLFSGCSIIKENEDSFKFKYLHLTTTTNFDNLTKNLLEQLSPTILSVNKTRTPLYVVDFVNLQDLQNNSELGFMLSDELKTQVTQVCNMPIYAIEYSKYLKIGPNGTKFLSRDLDELNNQKINRNTYALVGTYAFTQRQLILYLKLIDLSTGVIIKSATQKTLITDEIIHLENKSKASQNNIYSPVVL